MASNRLIWSLMLGRALYLNILDKWATFICAGLSKVGVFNEAGLMVAGELVN